MNSVSASTLLRPAQLADAEAAGEDDLAVLDQADRDPRHTELSGGRLSTNCVSSPPGRIERMSGLAGEALARVALGQQAVEDRHRSLRRPLLSDSVVHVNDRDRVSVSAAIDVRADTSFVVGRSLIVSSESWSQSSRGDPSTAVFRGQVRGGAYAAQAAATAASGSFAVTSTSTICGPGSGGSSTTTGDRTWIVQPAGATNWVPAGVVRGRIRRQAHRGCGLRVEWHAKNCDGGNSYPTAKHRPTSLIELPENWHNYCIGRLSENTPCRLTGIFPYGLVYWSDARRRMPSPKAMRTLDHSRQLQTARRTCSIPGGVTRPCALFARSAAIRPSSVRGRGLAYLWDADGNRYIDYIGSWGPMILGHAIPAVVEALEQAP